MTFDNGITVSVQFHPGTRSDNYNVIVTGNEARHYWSSETAEVMVFDGNDTTITKDFVDADDADIIARYQTVDQVLAILNRVHRYPAAEG